MKSRGGLPTQQCHHRTLVGPGTQRAHARHRLSRVRRREPAYRRSGNRTRTFSPFGKDGARGVDCESEDLAAFARSAASTTTRRSATKAAVADCRCAPQNCRNTLAQFFQWVHASDADGCPDLNAGAAGRAPRRAWPCVTNRYSTTTVWGWLGLGCSPSPWRWRQCWYRNRPLCTVLHLGLRQGCFDQHDPVWPVRASGCVWL